MTGMPFKFHDNESESDGMPVLAVCVGDVDAMLIVLVLLYSTRTTSIIAPSCINHGIVASKGCC